jgi:hypoxanthine phosphoribosyltransferase
MKEKMRKHQTIHKYKITKFKQDVREIKNIIKKNNWKLKYVYGIPRGGVILAVFLSYQLKLKYITTLKNYPANKVLVVDDVSDSGRTLAKIPNIKKYKTVTLFTKPGTIFSPDIFIDTVPRNVWIQYFWEKDFE